MVSSFRILLIITIVLAINSCYTPSNLKCVIFPIVNNNVCKTLTGKVVLYASFVDSKYTKPWSTHDIESTLDSIQIAINWVEDKAIKDSVLLDITLVYHQTKEGRIPIKNDFTKKTLSSTVYKKPLWFGIKDLYRWADKIGAEAGRSLIKDSSDVTHIKIDLNYREQLIAQLREIHRTDKVVPMYFVNNDNKDEISLTLDLSDNNNVEFSIVSSQNPSVITHELLHVFGASDFYLTPFDDKKSVQRKKRKLMELFPKGIMTFSHRDLNMLTISSFSKYLIGWRKELSNKHQKFLLDKGYFAIDY